MRFRKSAHATYKTEYHVVWTPRYRHHLFIDDGVRAYAETILKHPEGLADDIEVIELNIQPDHVHMVIVIPPRIAVARVSNISKHRAQATSSANFHSWGKWYGGAPVYGPLATVYRP